MSCVPKTLQPQNSGTFATPRLSPAANNNVAISNQSDSDSAGTEKPDLETFKLQITENSRIDRAYGWSTVETTLGEFEKQLRTHDEIEQKKNGRGFVPGIIQGERRNKGAVSELTALVLDLDKGEDWKGVRAAIDARGHYSLAYTTFSHLSPETAIKLDDYRKFLDGDDVTSEGLRRYLREQKKYRNWVLEDVEVAVEYRDVPNGAVCVARHAPLPKYRIVFPLLKPFRRRDYVGDQKLSQKEFEELWRAKYASFADSLGVLWDQACTDISRCFYYPSCKRRVRRGAGTIEGQLLDLDTINVDIPSDRASTGKSASTKREAPRRDEREHTFQGFDLKIWVAQYGSKFEIETALRATKEDGFFRASRDHGGVHIECPFEDEHSEAGGTGTFIVNAGENGGRAGFGIHCCHDSCQTRRGNTTGNGVDRLLFIQKMLEDGWLTLDDLQNPEFGGGPISARVYHQNQHSSGSNDLRVIDKDGLGIDAGLFHASMIAKSGLFDFEKLNQLCGTQISSDVTAKQLADFIENSRVTVAQLVECTIQADSDPSDDAYEQKLKALAHKKVGGKLLDHQVDKQLAEIRSEFDVRQKTIEKDFKRFEQQARSFSTLPGLGILSAEDAALVKPMRDYVKDFAIINTGGKGVVMALQQPDISKAIMPRDDFEFLHRNDWSEVVRENGSKTTVYPAKRFLAKPPKNAQVYRGGFVFKPSGTVAADQYNLYRGMLIEPDSSGDCSMLYDLIRDVWAQGDEQIAEWAKEYFMHIVSHPGEKVGTSIAIRGGYGDGKSIVFEQLMSKILGDMLLRVTNERMILGDFNESLIGKLVTVLEEAAFAGNKAAFDKMKDLIAGNTVHINPKFKAPITIDNYSRLIVISNHDHFVYMKPGDRRYTVLESCPAWRGTNKFEQLIDQWKNGGAQRFFYDALNHSFRRFDDRKTLVINTNLMTSAAVRQMAQSRSALEKCVVGFMLSGGFKSARNEVIFLETKNGQQIDELWELDKSLDIRSQVLEHGVASWMRDFDAMAARHETSLHAIFDTLQKYIGPIAASRPKGLRDASSGKRPQLATVRHLPPRKDALEHAWDNGLITDEEYGAALPEPTEPVQVTNFLAEETIGFPEEAFDNFREGSTAQGGDTEDSRADMGDAATVKPTKEDEDFDAEEYFAEWANTA